MDVVSFGAAYVSPSLDDKLSAVEPTASLIAGLQLKNTLQQARPHTKPHSDTAALRAYKNIACF